jgi:threonyl-tRNA synthetase
MLQLLDMQDEKLYNLRHSLAHVLAQAVLEKFPEAKLTIGPVVENGFYYDIDFVDKKFTENDFAEIEEKMRGLISSDLAIRGKPVSADEAIRAFANNPYKLELIEDIAAKGEQITLYYTGENFFDLCRGGHVESLKEIPTDCFKLDKVAGAYWKGDAKNKQLTRIYGLAFNTKEDLDKFLWQREEAEKRDHRKIGKEMGLFVFSDLVGAGLPLWTPRGTVIREELQDFVWELRKARGYGKVVIPHITKQPLYEKSGHWTKYSEDLFKIQTRDGHIFAMKPMNCPHHTQIFDSEPRSYRDMPQRYAESTMVYRDEQTGELSGLSRVISITQDDAHVFCRMNQIEQEAESIWEIIQNFYSKFGFVLIPRLSRRDSNDPSKYLGNPENWDFAEAQLKNVIAKNYKGEYLDGPGEAAFYGPKIDFMAQDAIGRKWQIATIQLDLVQPSKERFDLTCINEEGKKEQIAMFHCAIMGSFERFLSIAIEHFAGAFPVWLHPTQVSILPISDKHIVFAGELEKSLKAEGVRVELDARTESLGKKIRSAKEMKVPYIIVIGDKEVEAQKLTIETRTGKLENVAPAKFVEKIKTEIKNRSL